MSVKINMDERILSSLGTEVYHFMHVPEKFTPNWMCSVVVSRPVVITTVYSNFGLYKQACVVCGGVAEVECR